MAKEKPVHEQVQDLLKSWNKPPEDQVMERVVGVPTDEGDTRATAHTPMQELNHPNNPANDGVDAQRMYADDGDGEGDGLPEVPTDEDGNPDYDSMKNADLKEHLAARDLPVSGNHDDLVARLEESDNADEEEEEDEEDEE